MLLAIDVGNTTIAAGLFRGEELLVSGKLAVDRVLDLEFWWRDLARKAPGASVDRVLVATVNPKVIQPMSDWIHREFRAVARNVGRDVPWPMPVLVDNPDEVGADRVVNAYAAWRRAGRASIVVDFGTAVTFDVVSASGEYLGGVIVPGLKLSSRALAGNTALLPYVEVRPTEKVIGTNTVQAIASGLFHGAVGMVDHLIDRIEAELGEKAAIFATGGEASMIAAASRRLSASGASVVPELTLEGLRLIDEKTAGGA